MYIGAIVSSKKQRELSRSLVLYSREINYVEINQFVAVTDDLEFFSRNNPALHRHS